MAEVFSLLRSTLSHSRKSIGYCRSFHLSSLNMVKVGEEIPDATLTEGTPANKVNLKELCKTKKVVMFAVPGAFTPGCSKTHLPGYISKYNEIKSKGVDEIICVSVNDPFVMDAWGKDQKAEGKVRMLADADGSFITNLGLTINLPPLGGIRSKRWAMIVENNVVTKLAVEPDGTGLSCSLAEQLII